MTMNNANDDYYQHAISMLIDGSVELAIEKLKNLSKEGDGYADSVLGTLFEFGKNEVSIDLERAIYYYERSIDFVGSVEGWMGVGRISLYGPPNLRDYDKAFECFKVVADNAKKSQAWLALGDMHMYGIGRDQDLVEAEHCYKKALNLGHLFPYGRLANLAMKDGRIMESVKYRIFAISKFFMAIITGQGGAERLRPW